MSKSACAADPDAEGGNEDAQRGCGASESDTVNESGVISSISRLSGRVIGETVCQVEVMVSGEKILRQDELELWLNFCVPRVERSSGRP